VTEKTAEGADAESDDDTEDAGSLDQHAGWGKSTVGGFEPWSYACLFRFCFVFL
jgi:hypothetical protein